MLEQCWSDAGTMLGNDAEERCCNDAVTMLERCWGTMLGTMQLCLSDAGTMLGRCWNDAEMMLEQCWNDV